MIKLREDDSSSNPDDDGYSTSTRQALLVFLPFAVGYFLSYLFRSVNAVIAPNLISEFDLSASQLGLLTSVYFLTFASLQIPIGVFLDRFGPRRVNATLLVLASIGALIFSKADDFQTLLLGRAFIGFGVGFLDKPYIRFADTEYEQQTFFVMDPNRNVLEIKSLAKTPPPAE